VGEKRKSNLVSKLLEILGQYEEVELEDVTIDAEELEILLRPVAPAVPAPPAKPTAIMEVEFSPPIGEYPGRIAEVTLGATKADGGTRRYTITIGGETAPAFHLFEGPVPHPPVIAGDVFDMQISLPGPVSENLGDAIQDPIKWAKLCVDKFGVDLIDLELISTDPAIKNTPVSEATKLVEDVLQAVDVPMIIGGSGNPEKDAELLPKVAEVCEGERILLSSATEDVWEPVAQAAKRYGHVVLAWTSIDLNKAKELNRRLFQYIPKEQIVIDPTSAALGYGIEYAFTVMERIRLAGLMGDEEVQCPMGSGTANSWGAREAWKRDPELGPRELRGPLWETVAALTYLLAGNDIFIMLHPASIRTLKDVVGWLKGEKKSPTFVDWLKVKEGSG
jgi:acetyl-CoA decarbonylase/synthase complex subunit delta